MGGLSDHTKLINIIISLASKNVPKDWNNALWRLGYYVASIEPRFPIDGVGNSNPDIVLYSEKYKHIVIIDCKSKTLKEKQTMKYLKLKNNPKILINYGVVEAPINNDLSGDVSFASFHDISNNPQVRDNPIVILHVIKNENIIEIIDRKGNFEINDLNLIFPIQINSKPLYHLYPFDIDDTELFKCHIVHKLIKYAYSNKEFTLDELLRDILPTWDLIHDTEKRRGFKNRARDILKDLQNKGLETYLKSKKLSKSETRWYIDVKDSPQSMQAFIKKCKEIIEIKQETLDSYFK